MTKIYGTVSFGVKVKIEAPFAPSENLMKVVLSTAQAALAKALVAAVTGSLKLLPGVTASVTDADTKLTIDRVDNS